MAIVIPELVLYAVIKEWADRFTLVGTTPELEFVGIDQNELASFKQNLGVPKVGFIYPQTDTELPSITIVTDAITPVEQPLGRETFEGVDEQGNYVKEFGVLNRAEMRLFVVTNNPETTILLTNYLFAYLLSITETLQALGLHDPEFTITALSPWSQVLPSVGFRREIVVSCYYELYTAVSESALTNYKIQILDKDGNLVVEWQGS